MRKFRIYMAVGGMPQAVNEYIKDNRNFNKIDFVKRQIIKLYEDDLKKIDETGSLSKLYNSIPSQLANSKTKFSLTRVLEKKTSKKDKELLSELIDSKIVLQCFNATDPSIALLLNTDINTYKLYLSDIGLFVTMILNSKDYTDENLYNKLLSDKLSANLGYLYENAIAQIIASSENKLYYHTWYDENNKKNPYEIDFLITKKNKLIPIEVKSNETRNHKSINAFCSKYSNRD